ncbi:MAG TPA: SMI1/KNR4 family protein [Polyangiaceae bacterium]|nr:SMI1/KNR4 family protein [Polyangiaceae bacterium]
MTARLKTKRKTGRLPHTAARISKFEQDFGLKLPPRYKTFLREVGASDVSLQCAVLEPTPFGQTVPFREFFGFMKDENSSVDLRSNTEFADAAPVAFPIASDDFGNWIYLMCAGPFAGAVFFHDHEGRASWPVREFRRRFPNLHPGIQKYLELRRAKKLPKKHPALTDFYRLADSFAAFLKACKPA